MLAVFFTFLIMAIYYFHSIGFFSLVTGMPGGYVKEAQFTPAQFVQNSSGYYSFMISSITDDISDVGFIVYSSAYMQNCVGNPSCSPPNPFELTVNGVYIGQISNTALYTLGRQGATFVRITATDTSCDVSDLVNAREDIANPSVLCKVDPTLLSKILDASKDKKTFTVSARTPQGHTFGISNLFVIYRGIVSCPVGEINYKNTCVTPEPMSDSLHYRKYTCPIQNGYQAIMEAFPAGSVVNSSAFRFTPNYFCEISPIIVLDNLGQKLRSSTSEYEQIVSGKSVVVPNGEVWSITYIAHTTNLPLICPADSILLDNNSCSPSITYACSNGLFDPKQGLCVVQKESKEYCENGGTLNLDSGECVIYRESIYKDIPCPIGSQKIDNNCIYQPDTFVKCAEGTTYDGTYCVSIPNTVSKATAQDYFIWIFIGGIIILAIILVIMFVKR